MPLPSVTVVTVNIAVTGSARRAATQWTVREVGAGRRRAGRQHTHGQLDLMPRRAAGGAQRSLLEADVAKLSLLSSEFRRIALRIHTRHEHKL